MSAKRITDVSQDYTEAKPAKDAQVRKIKAAAKQLRTGKLEQDVDRLLASKGLSLNTSLDEAVKTIHEPGGPPRAKRLGR